MFTVQLVNPEAVQAIDDRLNGISEDVARLHLAIPDEFVAWQTEDMHRKYPNVEESGQTETTGQSWIRTWTTHIWPRSRLANQQRKPGQRKPRQGRRVLSAPIAHRGSSGRPILRPELFEKLRSRMRVLLDTISWKRK